MNGGNALLSPISTNRKRLKIEKKLAQETSCRLWVGVGSPRPRNTTSKIQLPEENSVNSGFLEEIIKFWHSLYNGALCKKFTHSQVRIQGPCLEVHPRWRQNWSFLGSYLIFSGGFFFFFWPFSLVKPFLYYFTIFIIQIKKLSSLVLLGM